MKEEQPHFTREELAARWGVTVATLDQWRWNGRGPRFFKPGRIIYYRVKDVELFEEIKARQSTAHTPYEQLYRALEMTNENKEEKIGRKLR